MLILVPLALPSLDPSQIVVPGAIGAALTFVVPLITRWDWPRWVKVLVTVILTAIVIAAVLIVWLRPETWEMIIAVVGFAFGVGQAAYQVIKPTGIFDWIEDRSTPVTARRAFFETSRQSPSVDETATAAAERAAAAAERAAVLAAVVRIDEDSVDSMRHGI